MSLHIALQMDPPQSLNAQGDTTLFLGREAEARGHHLYYLTPESVSQISGGDITGTVRPIKLYAADATLFFECGEAKTMSLADLDVILVRQDPPFDMGYISNSLLLEWTIQYGTLVLNHPMAVRNNPEKMIPFRFPDHCPPTLMSEDIGAIREFHKEHGAVVIKPAYGYGGRGIFKIDQAGENLEALLEVQLTSSREPLIVQKFLPDVMAEEKRIILINGEFAGAFGRIPLDGEIRSNMRVGGTAVKTELTDKQKIIAEEVGGFAKSMGLMLVGLDVIGDYLIEVNVTSPTGLVQLKELYGSSPEVDFWNEVENLIAMRDETMSAVAEPL